MSQTSEQLTAFARGLNDEIRERRPIPDRHILRKYGMLRRSRCTDVFAEAGVIGGGLPEVCVRGGRLGRANWELAGWHLRPLMRRIFRPSRCLQYCTTTIRKCRGRNVGPRTSAGGSTSQSTLSRVCLKGGLESEPAADAAALGRIIHKRRKVLRRVDVQLATDGLTQRLKSIESVVIADVEITCGCWDIDRLSRLYSDPKQEEIEIDVRALNNGTGIPCLRVPEDDPHYDAYLCVVPGSLLYHAYEQYGQRLLS